jgi:integrase
MLMTLYSCGLRRTELCRLKVSDIDSKRMMIRIEQGKGNVDREVPLSPKLLETLRLYWRWMRPKTYLFPGTEKGWRADKPIASRMVWEAVQFAAARAKLDKHVTPHTLRHSYATHQLEAGRVEVAATASRACRPHDNFAVPAPFQEALASGFDTTRPYHYDPIENRATLAPSTQT